MQSLKNQIRKEVTARQKLLSEAFKQTASAAIVEQFSQSAAFQQADTVALYMYFGAEVRLDALFPVCWTLNKRTCIPVYNACTKLYDMAEITPETTFMTGHYGIREPVSADRIPISDLDLIAVPGIAFDIRGNRLGRGGGYYDRILEHFRGTAVAVAFDFQILDHIPVDSHDIPVGRVITETKSLKV